MDAQRTRKVINRIIAENYPIEPRPTRKPATKLRSFRDVTGGLSKRTNVIISPKKRDTENNVNVNELSQQALRGYVKNASKDISQRKDDYVKDIIQSKREPKFKDVFRKIGNRAVGIQKASRRMTMPKEEAPTNSMGLSSSPECYPTSLTNKSSDPSLFKDSALLLAFCAYVSFQAVGRMCQCCLFRVSSKCRRSQTTGSNTNR